MPAHLSHSLDSLEPEPDGLPAGLSVLPPPPTAALSASTGLPAAVQGCPKLVPSALTFVLLNGKAAGRLPHSCLLLDTSLQSTRSLSVLVCDMTHAAAHIGCLPSTNRSCKSASTALTGSLFALAPARLLAAGPADQQHSDPCKQHTAMLLVCSVPHCGATQQSSSCFSLHMGHLLLFAGHTVPNASAQRAASFPARVGCRGRLPGLQAAGVASKRLELQQGFTYASRNHCFLLVACRNCCGGKHVGLQLTIASCCWCWCC